MIEVTIKRLPEQDKGEVLIKRLTLVRTAKRTSPDSSTFLAVIDDEGPLKELRYNQYAEFDIFHTSWLEVVHEALNKLRRIGNDI